MKKLLLSLTLVMLFGMGALKAQYGPHPNGHGIVVAEYFPDADDPDSPYVKIYIDDAPEMAGRSFQYYRVYRTNCYNDGPYTLDNTEVLACELHDTLFIDMSWSNLEAGVYKYVMDSFEF